MGQLNIADFLRKALLRGTMSSAIFEVDWLCYVSGWIWFNVREHYLKLLHFAIKLQKLLAHHSTCLELPVLSNKKQTKLFDLHDETLSVRRPWWLHALHNADGTKVVLDNSW